MLQLLKLFGLMFGIGSLTFGGGYAIVGVLQNYLVDKLHWMTLSEFTSGLVIGQVTPGPLSTMVAYVGYKVWGIIDQRLSPPWDCCCPPSSPRLRSPGSTTRSAMPAGCLPSRRGLAWRSSRSWRAPSPH